MQEIALQETMIYSVKTAVMGMLIVFSFLALLSLLMWAIKAFFGRVMQGAAAGKTAGRRAGKRSRSRKAEAGESAAAGGNPAAGGEEADSEDAAAGGAAESQESAENEKAETRESAGGAGPGALVPDWLSAAIAVYLLLEAEEAECSAEPWRPPAAGDPRSATAQLWILSGVYEQ
jgi:Na+-transporting methylmalonyl-CoA/oxaloacetate decarboxylase gamma subunit